MDNRSNLPKLSVAAFGSRDFYAIPLALEEGGMLDSLFTDFYSPDALANTVPLFRKRHREGLPSAKVRNYLMRASALRVVSKAFWLLGSGQPQLADDMLGRAVARYAAKSGGGILAYNWHWLGVTSRADLLENVKPKILVQIHPIATQIREVLARDRAATGIPFVKEDEEKLSAADVEEYVDRLKLADRILVPSRFVSKGLESVGVAADRIRVVSLVSKMPVASSTDLPVMTDRKLHLLFVGQLAQRKGAHYLLSALRRIPQSLYHLTMVCSRPSDPELLRMMPDHVDLRSNVPAQELKLLYRRNDLFVLPSLIEGFGLVYAEALAQGLPIVCTENTGGPDIITEGKEGFIVPSGDAEALAALFERCLKNLQSVREMRASAAARASACSWEHFRSEIQRAVQDDSLSAAASQ